MELTGKALIDFKEWYENPKRDHVGLRRKVEWFYTLTESMKFGVYQNFFFEKGILVNITLRKDECSYYVTTTHKWYQSFLAKNKDEVIKKSLKEACRWYEELATAGRSL